MTFREHDRVIIKGDGIINQFEEGMPPIVGNGQEDKP